MLCFSHVVFVDWCSNMHVHVREHQLPFAGLSPQKGRIVEIAAMELESRDSMQTLVNIAPAVVCCSSPRAWVMNITKSVSSAADSGMRPLRQVPWKATNVHRITTQMVHDPSLPTMRCASTQQHALCLHPPACPSRSRGRPPHCAGRRRGSSWTLSRATVARKAWCQC